MANAGLRPVLIRRWHLLPEYLRRIHWDTLTFDEKWDLTFQHSNPDAESRFDDLTYNEEWDLQYRSPKIDDVYAGDPILALEHVFEDRSLVPEVLDVLIYPSVKMGPSLPTHVEVLYWNGRFRYADEKGLTDVLDCRKVSRVQYYHPWGWWATLDCEKYIDATLIGPLLILRHGDHPEAGLHLEQTIGMRELSYQLFNARTQNFYIVLPEETFIPDTYNALSRFGWGMKTSVTDEEFKEAEYDSLVIALASWAPLTKRLTCLVDRISWELGGVHFEGAYGPDLPVSMAASVYRKELKLSRNGQFHVYQMYRDPCFWEIEDY